MPNKTCILCEHFYFESGEYDWSEITPGCKPSTGCRKMCDDLDFYKISEDQFREYLMRAATCKEFSLYKKEKGR